jgi:hypothetical protein
MLQNNKPANAQRKCQGERKIGHSTSSTKNVVALIAVVPKPVHVLSISSVPAEDQEILVWLSFRISTYYPQGK